MSKRTLGDTLFRAAVTVLAGGSLLAGVGVAMGMVDRFNYLRQVSLQG